MEIAVISLNFHFKQLHWPLFCPFDVSSVDTEPEKPDQRCPISSILWACITRGACQSTQRETPVYAPVYLADETAPGTPAPSKHLLQLSPGARRLASGLEQSKSGHVGIWDLACGTLADSGGVWWR